MQYTVVGAGAIGGTVGAHMVRGGEDVVFVDRDRAHVDAMRQTGLTIRSDGDSFNVSVRALTPDELPSRLDTVLLAVKAPATDAAVRSFVDKLAADGCVVSLQNGLNEPIIARHVGQARTVGAFVNFSADYLEPGVIQFGGPGAFYLGELDGSITPRLESLRSALGQWGEVRTTDNLWGYLWGKQAYGAMLYATSLSNDSMAEAIDRHRPVMVELAREVLSVARGLGIDVVGFDGFEPEAIAADDPPRTHASLDRLVALRRLDHKTHSGVWRDLAVRKRPTEVDAHFGPVLAEARRLGLDAPILTHLVQMIHEIEASARSLGTANLVELASTLGACAEM
jgi:2-dehydropantoate 2-reductase